MKTDWRNATREMFEAEKRRPTVWCYIRFSVGTYRFPAIAVAEHRARHYEHIDPLETPGQRFLEELWVMDDEGELLDWMKNNMNWSKLAPYAEKVADPPMMVDWEGEWRLRDVKIEFPR